MQKDVLLILVGKREEDAVKVQSVLTRYAANIKTRLGLHDGVLGNSSNRGLIFCELAGEQDAILPLVDELNTIDGIHAEHVAMKVD